MSTQERIVAQVLYCDEHKSAALRKRFSILRSFTVIFQLGIKYILYINVITRLDVLEQSAPDNNQTSNDDLPFSTYTIGPAMAIILHSRF